MNDAEVITIDANDLKVGFGVEATAQTATAKKVAKKESTRPKAVGYKVYCNGEVKAQQSERTYKEVLKTNGEFDYFVTSVFENGWESPASKVVVVDNPIVQASPAPYSLKGNLGDNGTLKLSWKASNEASVLTYMNATDADMALGLTGSGTREAYAAVRFLLTV